METTYWSGICKVQAIPCHISGEILKLNVSQTPSRERRLHVDIARVTGVTQGGINNILKRARQIGSPNQRPRGHRQRISTPRKDRYLLSMMRANRFLSSPRLGAQMIRHTGRRLWLCSITRRLPVVGHHSNRSGRCPKLTLVDRRPRQWWAKRYRVWDIRHSRHCIFTDGSRFKLQMDELGCVGRRVISRLIYVYREQIVMLAHLASYRLDFPMLAKVSWLCWTAPWTSKCTDMCCNKVS